MHTSRVCCVRPLAFEHPCGFECEGGKCEPVNVHVQFEVGEGEEDGAGEMGGELVNGDAAPNLVGERVEEDGPVSVLDVLDCVKLLEHSRDGNDVDGYAR